MSNTSESLDKRIVIAKSDRDRLNDLLCKAVQGATHVGTLADTPAHSMDAEFDALAKEAMMFLVECLDEWLVEAQHLIPFGADDLPF